MQSARTSTLVLFVDILHSQTNIILLVHFTWQLSSYKVSLISGLNRLYITSVCVDFQHSYFIFILHRLYKSSSPYYGIFKSL